MNLEVPSLDSPSVEWFVTRNIPVWYPISNKILDFTRKNPTNPLSKFVPPPEILDVWIQPQLTKPPDPHASGAIQSNTPANPAKKPDPYISWQEFFSRCATCNAAILTHEGPQEQKA